MKRREGVKKNKTIATAADAAQALGPFAISLFAFGFIGASLIAVPIVLASTSYAVGGTFGWPVGLAKKLWQGEGFSLILTVALVVSVALEYRMWCSFAHPCQGWQTVLDREHVGSASSSSRVREQ